LYSALQMRVLPEQEGVLNKLKPNQTNNYSIY